MIRRAENFGDMLSRLFPDERSTDGKLRLAKTVTFQVTDDCNLRCTYCYQHNKGNHVMPLETAKQFFEIILNDNSGYIEPDKCPGLIVEFIGGEPWLEIELIDQITDHIISRLIELQHPWATRFRLSICSNGLLHFDPRVQNYLQKHRNRLSYSISIDGNKELHDSCRIKLDGSGSYDIAMAGVRDWTAKGVRMGSKMTLAPQNIDKTCAAVISLINNGYTEIYLNCVYEKGWETKHATILYHQLKQLADYMIECDLLDKIYVSIFEEQFFCPKNTDDVQNWCGGNGAMIACDYKGDIYPCIRYMESSLGDNCQPLIIGNVTDGLLHNTCQKQCYECLSSIDRRSQSTEECFNCPIAEGCSWCTAYNYEVFGTPDKRATYICEMHKARALANAYAWNKKYQKETENKFFKIYTPDEWALPIIGASELKILKELEHANKN